jgi:hypothetical protein
MSGTDYPKYKTKEEISREQLQRYFYEMRRRKCYTTPWLPPLCWGYIAITLWPFGIFFRNSAARHNPQTIRHEKIHWEQQKEMFGILFYIWYGLEYLVRLSLYLNHWEAYNGISFELEANYHEDDPGYLLERKHFSWCKWI